MPGPESNGKQIEGIINARFENDGKAIESAEDRRCRKDFEKNKDDDVEEEEAVYIYNGVCESKGKTIPGSLQPEQCRLTR